MSKVRTVARPLWGRGMEYIELSDNVPRLITAGCSFAIKPYDRKIYRNAFDETDSISWGELLSNKTYREFFDWSKEGSGSEYAYRVIIDSVLENLGTDIMVVVGWSSIGRWEIFSKFDGQLKKNMLYDMRDSEEVNIHKFYGLKEYQQHALNYTCFQDHLKKLDYIIGLGNFLKSHNIKYLFFNAFESLDSWKNGTCYFGPTETGKDCPVLTRKTNYIRENLNWFDRIQIEIGAKEGYYDDVIVGNFNNPGSDPLKKKEEYFLLDGWHPSKLAHREWSEILYNEICNRY